MGKDTLPRQEGVSPLRPGAPSGSEEGSSEGRQRDPAVSRRGSAARDEQANPSRGQADRAAARVEDIRDEQENVERELARPDISAKRIRDLQAKADRLENELAEAREQAARSQREWPARLVQWAQEGKDAKTILSEVQKHQTERQARQALEAQGRSEPNEIIGELLDSDDDDDVAFARFLRREQRKGVNVTRKNLATFREDFEEWQDLRARADAREREGDPAAEAAQREAENGPRLSRRTPPKVARPGSRETGAPARGGWKQGQSTQDLLAAGFREQDEQRGAAAGRVH